MSGELLSDSPVPVCWSTFAKTLPPHLVSWPLFTDGFEALQLWMAAIRKDVDDRWNKPDASIIGFDIKYNQMPSFAPRYWDVTAEPFFLHFVRKAGAKVIHLTRRNIFQSIISGHVADHVGQWHYTGDEQLQSTTEIDPEWCYWRCVQIQQEQVAIENHLSRTPHIDVTYEDLTKSLKGLERGARITSGPLMDIADFVGVEPHFTMDNTLKKAVSRPYNEVIRNFDAVRQRFRNTPFEQMVLDCDKRISQPS